MSPSSFLAPLESRILNAYATAIPERQDVLVHIRSKLEGIDIRDRGDSFGAIPRFSVVTMGWWAVEVVWCVAYCVEVWGGRFKGAMEDRATEVYLDQYADDFIGLGMLKAAVESIDAMDRVPWLHANVPDFPYASDGTPFDDAIKATENVFLGAIDHQPAHGG